MKYNTITKQVAETVPGGIYEQIDYHGEPPADVAARAGWVDVTPEIQLLIDADKAAQDAANAAAQAEYLAGVDVLPRPVQGKFETSAADGHVYGLEIDPDGGEVIPVQRESTRLTQAEYDAAKATRLAERATHRDRIAAIKTDLDQVETALDQIDATTTGPMGLAITATSGATKTALQEVRKVIADMKTATKNLKQAAEKLRREVK
jgi:signal transduction histidine kinase